MSEKRREEGLRLNYINDSARGTCESEVRCGAGFARHRVRIQSAYCLRYCTIVLSDHLKPSQGDKHPPGFGLHQMQTHILHMPLVHVLAKASFLLGNELGSRVDLSIKSLDLLNF